MKNIFKLFAIFFLVGSIGCSVNNDELFSNMKNGLSSVEVLVQKELVPQVDTLINSIDTSELIDVALSDSIVNTKTYKRLVDSDNELIASILDNKEHLQGVIGEYTSLYVDLVDDLAYLKEVSEK